MSKYNHIKSIPIESIPKKKIKRAIHEWAEGDDAMERLLWACYDKGIKTAGCHADARPWIDFKYQENLNRIIPFFEVTQEVKGSQILIMVDGGNPFSGPEWFLSAILVGIDVEYKDEVDVYFDKLTEAIEKDFKKTHPLLELLEFFLNKESSLLFRFRHKQDDTYVFYIEAHVIRERYEYYDKVFKKAGLIEIVNKSPDGLRDRYGWKIEDTNLEKIWKRIEKAKDIIIKEYSMEPEEDEERIVDFVDKTRLKKKTLSEKEFNKWLKKKKKELFKKRG